MGFTSRHPRYTMALIVGLFVSVLVFANSDPPMHGHQRPYPPSFNKGRTSMEDQIHLSEEYYNLALGERQRMITKWGPSPSDIDPFPSSGEFYTLWDFFTAAFQCPHRMERLGNGGDGGKWVCGMERVQQKKDCVIYSVGINGESSFEAHLLERGSSCQVWGYDFSVKSFGPEIEKLPDLKRRSHFKSYALGGRDAPNESPPVYTLATLMAQNNHTFIDILKIDIEGAEFATLDSLMDAYPSAFNPQGARDAGITGGGLPFGQLQLEIHARDSEYASFPRFQEWWEKMERAGLRPFWTEPNLVYVNLVKGVKPTLAEYSFINIRGKHELVSDFYLH
ncbi:hypothetical protein FIBSPDRAFT_719945 [Athelia psychrophila]|uniref:Methyltransferase domain-containing protein n=1 Tax=Athelia psychrophila TaxID=1759441 RepID=A0A166WX46_9AGAM|nr:hypothetical protein FIBSPDRAFT_719945 [Fibularhizoctonia sp. CBS 109695]